MKTGAMEVWIHQMLLHQNLHQTRQHCCRCWVAAADSPADVDSSCYRFPLATFFARHQQKSCLDWNFVPCHHHLSTMTTHESIGCCVCLERSMRVDGVALFSVPVLPLSLSLLGYGKNERDSNKEAIEKCGIDSDGRASFSPLAQRLLQRLLCTVSSFSEATTATTLNSEHPGTLGHGHGTVVDSQIEDDRERCFRCCVRLKIQALKVQNQKSVSVPQKVNQPLPI
jgi:hypothetical protein